MKKTYIAPSIDALNMYSVMQPLALSDSDKQFEIKGGEGEEEVNNETQVFSKKWGTKLWEDM